MDSRYPGRPPAGERKLVLVARGGIRVGVPGPPAASGPVLVSSQSRPSNPGTERRTLLRPVRIGWRVLLAILAVTAALDAAQVDVPQPVLVPAGTTINVRLTQPIEVDVAQAGMTFRARVDDPVNVDGHPIIPREAIAVIQVVKVAQSGEFKGKDQISLKLSTVSVGGRVYPLTTEYATIAGQGESKRTARKVGGGAGLGAVVGGIAGGGTGALVGALVGGVAGTAVAASGEEHLSLPAETRLQFKMASAVRIQP